MATALHTLSTDDDLEAALDASQQGDVVLYKHSSTCSISSRAEDEMKALAQNDGPPIYEVVVQTNRPLSNDIEERFGIRHETPQAILVRNGEAIFNASHGDVTAQNVRGQLTEAP